ncbi:hypothetical protein CROQUDRAFT_30833, partial [Cronartium quercuum f. sp. fusiforme G11]
LKTLCKQTAHLVTCLNAYQSQLASCCMAFPNQAYPPNITHDELLSTNSNHTFWNNGLFTNAQEPWAVDPDMQHGILHTA